MAYSDQFNKNLFKGPHTKIQASCRETLRDYATLRNSCPKVMPLILTSHQLSPTGNQRYILMRMVQLNLERQTGRMRRVESGSGKASELRLAHWETNTIDPDLTYWSIVYESHVYIFTMLWVSVSLFNKGNEKHCYPVSELRELFHSVWPLNFQ